MKINKKILLLILAVSILFGLGSFSAFAKNEALALYVSLDGNDSNDGTLNSPFQTLEAARDYIRRIKQEKGLPNGNITVYIRKGEYSLNKTFYLTKEDSGNENCRITYCAYPGEFVNLIGGKTIAPNMFEKASDEAVSRIPEEARDKVYQVDLKELGYTSDDIGEVDYRGAYSTPELQSNTPWYHTFVQVFEDDEPQILARYPNEGYIYIKTVVDNCVQWFYDQSDPSGFTIAYEDTHLDRWANIKGAKLYGFFTYDFADATIDIKEVNTRKRMLTGAQATAFGVKAADGIGGRYYGFNMLEELDVPGEYYVDKDNAILYYYPKGDINTAKIQFSMMRSSIITGKECDYTTFKDLNMSVTRVHNVELDHCSNFIVDGCTLYNSGYFGIRCYEGINSGIKNSEIFNIANGGVVIDSYGGKEKVELSNNFAVNNKIHDYGLNVQMCVGGAILSGVGNYFGYNEVYNGPAMGIMMHQVNETTIEYNDFHDVMQDTSDCGVIYWGMSHRQLGQLIRYNYMHDNGAGQVNLIGVYADGGVGGIEMYGNIIANIEHGLGVSTFGSNNNIYNNLFINMNRGAVRGFYTSDMVGIQEGNTQLKDDEESDYKNDYWRAKYPFLYEELNRKGADYYLPVRNTVKNNIDIDGVGDESDEVFISNADEYKPTATVTKNQVNYESSKDKIIVDQESIKKFIPDWENIPIDKIGPHGVVGNVNYSKSQDYGGNRVGDEETIIKPSINENIDSRLNNAVVLKISSSNALIKNQRTKIDNTNNNVVPVIKESRTLLPVRFLSEAFGFEVKWDEALREVTLIKNDKTIKMKIDENVLNVNGEDHIMDTSATIIEGRTMIPLRALCEIALSKKVFWDSKGLVIVSDIDNIVDSIKDENVINNLINNLK